MTKFFADFEENLPLNYPNIEPLLTKSSHAYFNYFRISLELCVGFDERKS